MSCTIVYSEGSKINRVNNSKGEESKVFNQIASIPHVESLEDALEVYKNVFNEEENPLTFVSDKGGKYTSFKEALDNSNNGSIEIVLNETPVMSVSSNTNVKSTEGFINYHIKAGTLSDVKVLEDGQSYFVSAGNDAKLQIVRDIILKEDAALNLGANSFTVEKDGRIKIKKEETFEGLSKEDILAATDEELKNKLGDVAGKSAIVGKAVRDFTNNFLKPSRNPTLLNEEQIKERLLQLLNNMGVTVTSIEDYKKQYKVKNGVEPSASALADIGNRVVAFSESQIAISDLTEETAHFIVESWDEAEIENLLRNINKTDTYQQFAEQYREIYSRENSTFSEEEVEQLVRKEILGKEIAKSLLTNFSTENAKTGTQKSIIEKIRDLFINFFRKLVVTDEYVERLNYLTESVQDLLIQQNLAQYLDLAQLENKKFKLYNNRPSGSTTVDTQINIANDLLHSLQEQEKTLKKIGVGSSATILRLKAIQTTITSTLDRKSIFDMIGLAYKQARYVEEAVIASKSKGKTLSNEEQLVLHNLRDYLTPLLGRLKDAIKDDQNYKGAGQEIDKVTSKVVGIQGSVDNIKTDIIDKIIDNLIKRHPGLNEQDREQLRKGVENAQNDTQMLYSVFGQVTHAQDTLLNLLGSTISDMTLLTNQRFLKRAKTFQNDIRDLGFREADLKQFYDGDGWMMSLRDNKQFHKDLDEKKAEIYIKLSGSTLSTAEVITKTKRGELESLPTAELQAEYSKLVAEALSQINEMPFDENYYKERDEKYDKIKYTDIDGGVVKGISQETKTALRLLSIDRSEMLRGIKKINGIPVFSRKNKFAMDALNLQRREMKSFYDTDGKLKEGISISKTPTDVLVNDVYYAIRKGASKEAMISYEINVLDLDFRDKNKGVSETKLSDDFIKELISLEDSKDATREDVLDFFLLNTNIGFNDNFFEDASSKESFISRMEEYLSNNINPDLQESFYWYKQDVAKRKQILKKYQDSKSAMNTMADEISADIKKDILTLSDSIETKFKEFAKLVPQEQSEEESNLEVEPNQAYFDRIKDEGYTIANEQLKFTLEHLSPLNTKKYRELESAIDAKASGKEIPKYLQSIITSLGSGDAESLKLKYAQSKLAPYYKTFAPKGTSEFYDSLKNSNEKVADIVKREASRGALKMTNHYLYYENRLDNDLNPKYIKDYEGGYYQPKLDKYESQSFISKFSPKRNSAGEIILDEKGNITPSKDKEKLYGLYRRMIDFQKESLDAMDETGAHNIYTAPQVSRTNIDKIVTSINSGKGGAIIKEWFRELTNFRVDELLQGEVNKAGDSFYKKMGVRVVPKYFLRLLEETADVTDDLFYSLTAMAQQAELHKARKEKYSEFVALKDAVLNDRRYADGKASKTTNTWRMFESYMDANLFGIHEVKNYRVDLPILGSVDVAKIASSIHDWVRHKSLAFNLIVPMTSWITASTQIMMDKYIEQYIDRDSYSLGNSRFKKISTEAIKENMAINSTSELSVLGEYTQIFNLESRFKNSKYGWTARLFGKASYVLHTAGNFVPLSKTMLASLYGHRLVGSEFMDYNTFKNIKPNENKSSEQLRSEWSSLKDNNFYSYMNIKETVRYDYDRLAKDMGRINNEAFREEFANIENGVLAKIKKIMERVDGQITDEERTYGQRHFLLKFMTTHKGWLSITAANRFKRRHINLQTGQREEGSYVTAYNFIGNLIGKAIKDKKAPSLKEFFDNLSNEEKINLKRVSVEMGVLNVMFLMGLLFTGFADDDKNKDLYAVQLGAYLWERLVNETSSAQLGVTGELYSSFKEPVVGLQTTVDGLKFWNLFNTDIQDRGQYAGLQKNTIHLIKQIPGVKQAYTISTGETIYKQRQSYNYFNTAEDYILAGALVDEEAWEEFPQ